jgi:hypothetical protein
MDRAKRLWRALQYSSCAVLMTLIGLSAASHQWGGGHELTGWVYLGFAQLTGLRFTLYAVGALFGQEPTMRAIASQE